MISLSFTQYKLIKPDKTVYGIVVEKLDKKTTILTKYGRIMTLNDDLCEGDYGLFTLKETTYETEVFSYNEYLVNKGYKGLYNVTYRLDGNRFVIGKIRSKIINILDNNYRENEYIKLLFLGIREDDDLYHNTSKIGISFLLAISGLHIAFMVGLLERLLDKLTYKKILKNTIIISFLILFNIITMFKISVLRASICVILRIIFKDRLSFTPLDILSITGLMFLIIHPKTLYLTEFILSYLIAFIISLANVFNHKNKIINTFIISGVCYLTSLPIIINLTNEINLISLITIPIYSLLFELLIMPLALLNVFSPHISFIYTPIYSLFEKSIEYFSNINILSFNINNLTIYEIIAYIILLFLFFVSIERKKGILRAFLMFVILSLIIFNKAYFNPFYEVTYLNVGQGDSIMIRAPHNSYTIVIDCYKTSSDLLKKKGVRNIDYLILTHGDNDHIADFNNLYNDFNVKNIVTTKYTTQSTLKEIISNYRVKQFDIGDSINICSDTYSVISPVEYSSNENDNSLVIYTKLSGLSFLFTGDIENDSELINIGEVDFLKASHHGASSSTSKYFLENVNPKNIIISVGKNNRYNHPNNTYLLERKNIYRTDISGNISIYFKNRRYRILTTK